MDKPDLRTCQTPDTEVEIADVIEYFIKKLDEMHEDILKSNNPPQSTPDTEETEEPKGTDLSAFIEQTSIMLGRLTGRINKLEREMKELRADETN